MNLSKKIPIYNGMANAGYFAWMSKKPKKTKRKAAFKVKGVVLNPMTEAVAMSLDRADMIKYIGKVGGLHWDFFQRRPFKLVEKPTFDMVKKNLTIKTSTYYYGTTYRVPIRMLALVNRGDANAAAYNRAARFIPMRLKRIKSDLLRLVEDSKKRTDEYLEELPLHKKLELFKSFTVEEQQLYDFIYKDVQEVFHPKEEEKSPDNGNPEGS